MKYNNSKYTIVLPLVISVSVLTGIFLQKYILNFNTIAPSTYSASAKYSKLDLILDYIDKEYVDSIAIEDLVENTIPKILENLDPHTAYIPATDFNEVNDPLEGEFEGIGVQFNVQKDTIVIIQVISGGPSEKVNLRAGDRIVSIDDSVVAGIGIRSHDVVKLLKGPKGTKVTVGIKRRGYSDLIDFTITRDKIPLYSIDVSFMPQPGIGYIKLSRFAMTTVDEFYTHIAKLESKGMKKLILDLRGNGGGILNAAIEIANNFLKAGSVITYTQGKAYPRKYYHADNKGLCKETELAILLDEGSASASEVLSGAIQDNDRGTIIGRRSFGKGLVMDQRMFSDGSAIRLTISRYYSPTGRCIQKPYEEGKEDYYHEIEKRFTNKELSNIDSIHFPDSLKYTTPGGKTVYGGGGIMPDIFIPLDTIGITNYFSDITNKGLLYEYSFYYADNNRTVLSTYKNADKLQKYLQSVGIVNQFVKYVEKNGIKPNNTDIKESEKLISNRLEAYIIRNILDDEGFFPIILQNDTVFAKALDILQ